jgi:hypothetical protein
VIGSVEVTDQSLWTVVGVQLDGAPPSVLLPYPVHYKKLQLVLAPLVRVPLSKS